MQSCIRFVLIFYAATTFAQKPNNNKQDDDRWIWGYVEETTIENRNKDKDVDDKANFTAYDPCEFYNPKKPSFKGPGKRISEEACEDYLWDIRLNEERSRRNKECFDIMYANKPPPPAAVGGRPTYSGEFAHMGALGWKAVNFGYIFKCGSTLISSKFVLTAAHCSRAPVDDTIMDSSPKIVRLNDKNLLHTESGGGFDSFTNDMNILRIINHPNYKAPKKYYDIALIELEQDVLYTNFMRPACLWTKTEHSELGRDATLTGWGVLKFGSRDISPELQAADVNIIDPEQCDRLLFSSRNRNWQGLMEHQLCAGKLSGGVDACQGDSGGPLQTIKYKSNKRVLYNIIGITSFGIGCALPNLPGIYTRVSSFIDWIEPIVWSNSTE